MLNRILRNIRLLSSQGNKGETSQSGNQECNQTLFNDYNENLNAIKSTFQNCNDIVIREFKIGVNRQVTAFIVMIDALINDQAVGDYLLKPLMMAPAEINKDNAFVFAKESAVFLSEVEEVQTIEDAVSAILNGDAVLFIEGFNTALDIDVKGWERRAIDEPETEAVVRGSREGFVETLRTNTSMLRRILKNSNLKFEQIVIGKQSRTQVCIAYIQGIVDEKILEEVRVRLKRINTDAILESGYIEAFIEDAPFSVFPTVGNSEKPDKVSAKLLEGRVAILVEGTPFVLTIPYLFIEAFQSNEDYYSRPYYASSLRVLRWIAFLISINLPALYVAIITYHHAFIPQELLISIAAALEGVPLPTAVEAIVMQLVYEVLREGGVRLPRPVGQAVSIVGALVIGEASVTAGLIGAPMVIIVALTAVSSFIVPAFTDVSFLLRILFLILAGVAGLYGVMLGTALVLTHICSLRSFGVPYTAPIAPSSLSELKDAYIRPPLWALDRRPKIFGTQNTRSQGDNNEPKPPKN